MKIIEKIAEKASNICEKQSATIVFLGDSVTQGCFEFFTNERGEIDTVFDGGNSYVERVREFLRSLFPSAQVNIINSGISGDTAVNGVKRFERDVAAFHPDLVVIGFALNDSTFDEDGKEPYKRAIGELIEKTKKIGAECILLTPNIKNSKVSCHISNDQVRAWAERVCANKDFLDEYVEIEKAVAKENNVKICDVYASWNALKEQGVDTTELLSNHINHPIRKMHYYTAIKLLETMFEV